MYNTFPKDHPNIHINIHILYKSKVLLRVQLFKPHQYCLSGLIFLLSLRFTVAFGFPLMTWRIIGSVNCCTVVVVAAVLLQSHTNTVVLTYLLLPACLPTCQSAALRASPNRRYSYCRQSLAVTW